MASLVYFTKHLKSNWHQVIINSSKKKIEEERTIPISFSEASIKLISKSKTNI